MTDNAEHITVLECMTQWTDATKGAAFTAALTAAIAALKATEWQPIESAPRDGTEICVCIPGKTSTWVAWWRQREAFNRRHKTGWHSVSGAALKFRPTHWMPLPAGPVEGGEG